MSAPVDIVSTDITRRQGDVSGTLLYIAPNGNPANLGGWTFTFSCQPGTSLQTVVWTPPTGHADGSPMTQVNASGFTIPGFNSSVTIAVNSSTGINATDFLYIPGLGVVQAQTVPDPTHITIYNSGFPGNQPSGTIASGVNIWEASNVGYTVMVLPSTLTDWNSTAPLSPTRSVGRFPYYIKYDTTDPSPGPFKKTFYMGSLWIQPQNDPTA